MLMDTKYLNGIIFDIDYIKRGRKGVEFLYAIKYSVYNRELYYYKMFYLIPMITTEDGYL